MAGSDRVCYGCIRNVDVYQRDDVYRLEQSTIRTIEPILKIREIDFGLTLSGSHEFRLNIYGPENNPSVGQRLEGRNVCLQRPSSVRPGLPYKNAQRTHYDCSMLDSPIIQHNLFDEAIEKDDLQSWSATDIRKMKNDRHQVSRRFHYFKRLPTELKWIITDQLAAHDKFNFLRSHKAAQNDISHAYGRAKAMWDRWFKHYTWLDKMTIRGYQPALIGRPYRNTSHEKIHLALVLVGQDNSMDWAEDSGELIQTLRWQEGNAHTVIIDKNESLHIGQPFGKTELQGQPNLYDSLRGSAFQTNRQISLLKQHRKTAQQWSAHTFMLYYEPSKLEPHPGTGLHLTTATIQTLSGSFRIQDARNPAISWCFSELEHA